MKNYLNLLDRILRDGVQKDDRTGRGISLTYDKETTHEVNHL